jgi:hypothetical protein
MKRNVTILVVCLTLLLVGGVGRYFLREARAHSTFESAQKGQSEASVLERLGPPDEVRECGENLWWNGQAQEAHPPKNEGQCKKAVRYNFFLHAFEFGYSSEGKLVERYEYVSE